jgi:hypothetical protein
VLVEDPLFCCSGVPSSPSGIVSLHLHSFLSYCHDVFLGSVSFVYHDAQVHLFIFPNIADSLCYDIYFCC